MELSAICRNQAVWATRLALLWVIVATAGCAGLPDWRSLEAHFSPPKPSDRFALPPEGTDVIGAIQVVTTRHEDTLADIARRYNLGYEEIVAANPGIDPWLPGEGTRVVLPTQFVLPDAAREGLVLNLAAMRLFYFPESVPGEAPVVITHPIGIGREGWQTPVGLSRITQKTENPAWTVPASVLKEHAEMGEPLPPVVPPGPDNPLGNFALRLSLPSYLIHGTNQPYGVGIRVSHGCVRLYPEDIARLFPEVPLGTGVTIINQPYLAGWRDGQLYLEAHPPLAEEAARWKGSLKPMEKAVAKKADVTLTNINWHKARTIAREARGIPIPVSYGSPELTDMLSRARRVPSIPPWASAEDQEG